MEGAESSGSLLQTYLDDVPDFSVCHVMEDDDNPVIYLRRLREQNKELIARVERNKAVDEMINYFTGVICGEFNQSDFTVAWKLYKEAHGVK